jgi:very-short-patch-repair endonuclease
LHHAVHTGRPADSDFEIAVMKLLAEHGYECEPQLGVTGYYLDLAVRDPGQPGRFLMGIECDGTTYHSAKSVRDRDRLRQQVLEGLGWKISRIWSTDWFKNSDACLRPILSELESLRSPIQENLLEEEAIKQEEVVFSESRAAYLEEVETQPGEAQESIDAGALLKEKLLEFHRNVIEKESPDTEPDRRLLRPVMLESLLNHLPCSKAEFLEYIPGHLRFGTAASEGKYIVKVCEIIADYGW